MDFQNPESVRPVIAHSEPTPEWIKDMNEYYWRNGGYRPEDIDRAGGGTSQVLWLVPEKMASTLEIKKD